MVPGHSSSGSNTKYAGVKDYQRSYMRSPINCNQSVIAEGLTKDSVSFVIARTWVRIPYGLQHARYPCLSTGWLQQVDKQPKNLGRSSNGKS